MLIITEIVIISAISINGKTLEYVKQLTWICFFTLSDVEGYDLLMEVLHYVTSESV